jgi:hypothetical protein
MAVFYNSSAVANTLSVSNLTGSSISALSTITGTAAYAASAGFSVSASNTNTVVSQIVFSNANSVTWGYSTGILAGTLSASAVAPGTINISAGTTSNNVSTLVFSNANGISFGLDAASTITARYSNTGDYKSYFIHPPGPYILSSNTNLLNGSTNIFQSFNVPYPLSIRFIRMPVTQAFVSTTLGTAESGTKAFGQSVSVFANLYSIGTGTNSNVLQYATGFSRNISMVWSYTYNNSTSNSYLYSIWFDREGVATSYTTGFSTSSAGIVFQTSLWSGFAGNVFLDVGTQLFSLSEGPYWLAVQMNSTTGTTGGVGGISALLNTMSLYVNTQYASGFVAMNSSGTAPVTQLKLGNGFWTTNTTGLTTNSLTIDNIRTNVSNMEIPFELINFPWYGSFL